MINIPNLLCNPCEVTHQTKELISIPSSLCECISSYNVQQNLLPVLSLCFCPEQIKVIPVIVPKLSIEPNVVVCYSDLIKNIALTKNCNINPSCKMDK